MYMPRFQGEAMRARSQGQAPKMSYPLDGPVGHGSPACQW